MKSKADSNVKPAYYGALVTTVQSTNFNGRVHSFDSVLMFDTSVTGGRNKVVSPPENDRIGQTLHKMPFVETLAHSG